MDLTLIHGALGKWAKGAVEEYGAKAVYLFGSLVYKGGAQFMVGSDVDLVVVLPDLASAVDRLRWMQRFSEAVADLEISLFRILKRSGEESLVSVVAVTDRELAIDVHKDGHREFFTANTFRDLVTGIDADGLPGAGTETADRFVTGALGVAQKLRNEYFAVSANGTPRLLEHNGTDPLPKRIMRAAAMAARAIGKTSGPGAEHDVKEGLELVSNELYARRDDDPQYRQLQDLVAVQRLARGELLPVEATHQLLLTEIIYDLLADAGDGAGENGEVSADASTLEIEEREGSAGGAAPPNIGTHADVAIETVAEGEAPERMGSSTAFFARRFAGAFPGVRAISWFANPDDIEQRMIALLKNPLTFPDGLPVWYWRGGNLQIESFQRLSPGLFLMDSDEIQISRVAAVPGSTYKRSFVYVRCDAMEPTGLYPTSDAVRAARLERNSYDYEEFGLFAGTTPVKRSEYDDGAAVIDGRLTDIRGKSELRVRYTTPYNFVIAANGSPINNNAFDDVLVEHLDEALRGQDTDESVVERLRALVERLPLRGGADA